MHFLILAIFCNLFSSCYLLETINVDDHNLVQPDGKRSDTEWPFQTFQTIQGNFYGQAQRTINPKPCSRRSNSESDPIENLSSPPVAAKKETLPNIAASLKPQSLRNGENDLKIKDSKPPPQSPQLPIIPDDLYSTRKAIPVSNPVIDSLEDSHRAILPDYFKEVHDEHLNSPDLLRSAPNSDYHPLPTSEVHAANVRNYPSSSPGVSHFIPANEYNNEPENIYISDPNNVIPKNEFRSTNLNTPHNNIESDFFPNFFGDIPTQVQTSEHPIYSERSEVGPVIPNKCLHEDQHNKLEGHSRRSMSNNGDDDKSNDILRGDKEPNKKSNNSDTESKIESDEATASVVNAAKNNLKPIQIDGIKSSNKTKSPAHEKSVSRLGRPQFNMARREMVEPTSGPKMGQSALMLMQSERICYACSTATNPSCWAPDRRTTVKYCRKGNNACITKTYGKGSTFTLIRDCGYSCDDSEREGLVPKYKSCSICHSELCNGAFSINGNSIMLAIILTALVKYSN